MANEKIVPTGVKIISVMYYIGAAIFLLFGILFLVGAGFLGAIADQIPFIGILGASLFVVGGIVLIGLGVLDFFVGKGLWDARNWARIVAIVFAGLGILMTLLSIVSGSIVSNIPTLIVDGVIVWYLMSNKEAFA